MQVVFAEGVVRAWNEAGRRAAACGQLEKAVARSNMR
jgi:hypothetical protein